MKRILFTPGIAAIEALGSITRLIAIADEIKKQESDCDILFRASGREAKYAMSCGYKAVKGYKPQLNMQEFLSQISKNSDKKNSSYKKMYVNSLCDVIKFKGLISKEYVQTTFKEELNLVQDFKPDLIFGEFETVMPIVAKKLDIPYFCTGGTPNEKDFNCFGFSNKTESAYEYTENYNELLKNLNLKTIESICELNQNYNSNKIFVPSIPELESLKDDSKNIFLGSVSPKNFIKTDFKFEKKRPLIYVYLSAGQITPEIYQKVMLDAFSDSEFDVIVTAGGNPRFNKNIATSSNIHFMTMVPSDKVIKMADIAIHHGGQNTTVQCIENEVPSIIFPGNHFERYFNAEKAAQIGCALNPGIDNFNSTFILKTCREIINSNTFKQNLNRYSNEIKKYGGASKAAEFILNYLK